MTNPYETAGRLTKAHRLASCLSRNGFTAERAALITPAEWIAVAVAAGVNTPSEETVRLTIRQLADFERALTGPDWSRFEDKGGRLEA